VVVTEVATRLRTGADVDRAWSEALRRSGLVVDPDPGRASEPGVPAALDRLARASATGRRDEVTAGALPGAVAACRLTHEIGAPMAQVLDRCAQGLTEAGQARSARAVALAGPRASARLIGVLPLLGLVMGAAVGADPLAVLLGGGAGTACLVAGVALLVAGNRWVAALERAARAAA
jgi:tight adherence protein B